MGRINMLRTHDTDGYSEGSATAPEGYGRATRAVTLFAYAALGWSALVGVVFLVTSSF